MIDRSLNYGRHVLEDFTRRIASEQPEAVLDLGAGRGDDLAICRRNLPTARLHALEGYAPNVAKLAAQGFDVSTVNLERDAFPFGPDSLDLVIANQILEHCKEVFWIFHEVSRTLRVGGRFYVGVPNLASLHSRLLLLAGRQPTCIQTASAHIRGFTKSDLVRFLSACFPGGYALDMFRGSNFYPFPPLLAKPLARAFPNSAACIFLSLRKIKGYEGQFLKFPVGLETNYWTGQPEAVELRNCGRGDADSRDAASATGTNLGWA